MFFNKYFLADQYSGDAIAGKSVGYGMQTYRADGNDALAVYHTVKHARNYILQNKEPAFIELMTYRVITYYIKCYSEFLL